MTGRQTAAVERVVLVQCTGTKRDEPAPARDLYDESSYFRSQRAYAEAVADAWFIQSAEHGLVDPETVLEPYNTHAKDLDDPDAWAVDIAEDLAGRVHTTASVEVLGGHDYADPLTPELEVLGFDVVEPLRGQRIGERKSSLASMTNRKLEGYS